MSALAYMQRPEELAKHRKLCLASGETSHETAEECLRVMADGDADVFSAMWSFWNFAHMLDDLLDETGMTEETREVACSIVHDGISTILLRQHNLKADELLARWIRKAINLSPWSDERKGAAHVAASAFIHGLIENPFLVKNAVAIHALMVSALLRCLGGDAMARRLDHHSRTLAPAVSCGDVDVLVHMVYLARGFAAATVWSEMRDYDRKEVV